MDTLKLQRMWPDIHSDTVRAALRTLPSDVVLCLPEEMLIATVRRMAKLIQDIADAERAAIAKAEGAHVAALEAKEKK